MGTASTTDLLLVEDDGELVAILSQGLAAMGYPAPRVAHTGEEALRTVAERTPDLVLLDVMLHGGMDGFETARRMREKSHVPVIFITGRHDQAALDLARSAEAYAYLVKPVALRELAITLDLVTAKANQERELRKAVERLGESERRYRELLDGNPVGIVSFQDGRIRYANPMALRLLGADAVEPVIDKPLKAFFHAGESDVMERILGGAGSGGSPLEAQITGLHRRVYVVEIVLIPNGVGAGMLFLTDITEKKRAESRAGYLAYYDPLTALPNRKLLFYHMELELLRAMEKQKWMLLILVGLDRFSQINETLGHDIGDRLLLAVSERLKTILGPADFLARLGGDEFALIFNTELDETQVHWLVYSILNLFEKPFLAGGRETPLSAGVGVAIYPRDGDDTATLFRNADFSLKQAKMRGRNCFQFYDHELGKRVGRIAHLELELRDALLRREFTVAYQPQVDLGGRLVGAEALLRWNSAREGQINPGEFIPIIEENRQIIPIGYWVLEETCRQLAAWKRQGLSVVRVGVNLSPFQFQDGELCKRIQAIIKSSGIDPSLLGLEVTESGVMAEGSSPMETLRELQGMGIHISLDDFGSGYSSFSKLLHLPFDVMKLDKSFVQPIDTDLDARQIVTAMIQLGRNLNLKVLAEGVENARQLEMLAQLKCDFIQGFYFSRPLDTESFADLLSAGRIERSGSRSEDVFGVG